MALDNSFSLFFLSLTVINTALFPEGGETGWLQVLLMNPLDALKQGYKYR